MSSIERDRKIADLHAMRNEHDQLTGGQSYLYASQPSEKGTEYFVFGGDVDKEVAGIDAALTLMRALLDTARANAKNEENDK